MAQTQIEARYGSDAGIYDHRELAKTRFSDFPIGRKNDFTLDPGAIVPVDIFPTLPGDEFDISIRYLLKTMPLVAAPFTVYHVRTHWYYCKGSDLWSGFNTMITKGRSGSLSLSVPSCSVYDRFPVPYDMRISSFSSFDFEACTPQSLSCYLGFSPFRYNVSTSSVYDTGSFRLFPYSPYAALLHSGASLPSGVTTSTFTGISDASYSANLLPFMMYQKIYRDNYVSPNLLQDNKIWFPDDVTPGWRIDYSGSNLFNSISTEGNMLFVPSKEDVSSAKADVRWSTVPSLSDNCVNLFALRYAMFENDRFTTALPWATRGQAPSISSASISGSVAVAKQPKATLRNFGIGMTDGSNSSWAPSVPFSTAGTTVSGYMAAQQVNGIQPGFLRIGGLTASDNPAVDISDVVLSNNLAVSIGLTADNLRTLLSLSVWQERNARTQGNYNAMIFAHFRTDPNSQEHEPIYIGGTSDLISFSDVVQSVPTAESPAGTSSGLGMTQASGHVGHFRSPDYGYIMGVMIVSPQVTYGTGIEKFWTQKVMEDFYFPEDEGLGLEEVMTSELVYNVQVPDRLFGYQERNTAYKSRHNKVAGMFALPPSADALFSSFSQARFVTDDSAYLSQDFLSMSWKNMRRDYLAYPSYPAMMVSFADNIRARRPMSYQNVPNTFGF